LGTAITIIAITALRLAGVDLRQFQTLWQQKQCGLSDTGNTAICLYAYALGVVSIIFSLAIGLMQVIKRLVLGCVRGVDSGAVSFESFISSTHVSTFTP